MNIEQILTKRKEFKDLDTIDRQQYWTLKELQRMYSEWDILSDEISDRFFNLLKYIEDELEDIELKRKD